LAGGGGSPPLPCLGCGAGTVLLPVKQAVSLRLDADVLAWLKKAGEGYQTRANRILRERMLEDLGVE